MLTYINHSLQNSAQLIPSLQGSHDNPSLNQFLLSQIPRQFSALYYREMKMTKEIGLDGMKGKSTLNEEDWGGIQSEETAEGHLWILDVDDTLFRPMWEGEVKGGYAQNSPQEKGEYVNPGYKFTVTCKQ